MVEARYWPPFQTPRMRRGAVRLPVPGAVRLTAIPRTAGASKGQIVAQGRFVGHNSATSIGFASRTGCVRHSRDVTYTNFDSKVLGGLKSSAFAVHILSKLPGRP